jgi:PREDICTED: rCG54054-like
MKNYKLSEENKKIEIKHKKDIENNTIRRDRIYDRIKRIKLDSKLTHDEKRYQILNAEIELKELIMQIDKSNNRLSELYAKQAQSNINKKEPDSTTQRTKDDLRSYIDLNNYMNEKDMLYLDIEILEDKISFEILRKNRGEIDEDTLKKNIEEFRNKINDNEGAIEYYEIEIKEANYKHKYFDIKNDFNEGKITHKEYKEKEKELEEIKDDIKAPTRKEINAIFERVEEKTLEVEVEPKKEEKDLDKEYEDFKKTLDEAEFENDFDKSLIEMLLGEFGSNGINESDLENAKRVFNESRENLEKGKEQEKIEVEKVEKTERGIW